MCSTQAVVKAASPTRAQGASPSLRGDKQRTPSLSALPSWPPSWPASWPASWLGLGLGLGLGFRV